MKASNVKLSRTIHAQVLMRAEWIFITAILTGFLINFFWPVWTIPKLIRIIFGLILVVISSSIMLPSWELFKKEKTPVNPYKQTKSLVTTGPYNYSRNPQYLSRVLVQMALGFFFGNIWIIIMVIPAISFVWYSVIIPEERYLEQRFGKKYLQYKTSVRCWL
jgi:protein-S-isoprenylcysteine O-methyltransferase Ste14